MSTSVGFGLLKSALEGEASFSSMSDFGIDGSYFVGDEVAAYNFIREFISEHGNKPQLATVARHINKLDCFEGLTEEPISYWVGEVLERKRYKDIRESIVVIRDNLERGEVAAAIDRMGSDYLQLRNSYVNRRMVNLRDSQQEVLRKHDEAQQSGDIIGVPFGFPYLDEISGGAQGGDYIVVVGKTGVGKTYVALNVGKSAYEFGKNVLFISTEMPNLQLARRYLAMEGGFSASTLKMGRLSYYGRLRAERIITEGAALSARNGNYFHLLPGGMFPSVSDIAVVTRETKPDILIVDGAYILQGPSKASWWERNMEVASILKNIAMDENIPIIATYQYTKKDSNKLEGVGGGFAIVHIASIVFSFEYERQEDEGNLNEVQYRKLALKKGRDGESGTIRVIFDMKRTSISQDRVLSGRISEEDLQEPDLSPEMDNRPYEEI